MYVMPFWSYRHVEGGCVITNWLTKKTVIVPPRLVVLLETLYNSEDTEEVLGKADECLAEAHSLRLVFETKERAAAWYCEVEESWSKGFPTVEQIELTNRCPYSCKMCPRTMAMERSLGDMSLDLFEHIIEELTDKQDYIGLHHFGESLLHPGLVDAIAVAHRHGLHSGLSCNPPTLRPQLGARLLDAGISNVVLSLDSLDPQTYREIRGTAARLDRADTNVREFVSLRDRGRYETFITLQMISMSCNNTEADQFLEYCRDAGVDRGVVIRLGRWDFDDAYVKELGEFNSPGYTAYCTRPWDSVVVLWDGRVVPCCHDYDGAVVIGDLRTQSLETVWSSAAAMTFRQRNYTNEFCQKCAFSRWYREQQRDQLGFRAFHQDRGDGRSRKEWINPNSLARVDGRAMFNGFDILPDEQ
jgi:radical SAM protein with 4Fe4S-binding SPASM domain